MGVFISADALVPSPGDPRTFNRYAYVSGNPLKFIDPSGHAQVCDGGGSGCGGYRKVLRSGGGSGYSGGGSYGGSYKPVLSPAVLASVKRSSRQYYVPWQVVAGLLDAEVRLDTSRRDIVEDLLIKAFPPIINVRKIPAVQNMGFAKDAGPGIGNVHLSTARRVSQYLRDEYPDEPEFQLNYDSRSISDERLSLWLTDMDANVKTVAAIVRQLADYRFGTGGQPRKQDHSALSQWTMTDALMVWHAYRYGVPQVSPGAQGFVTLDAFQNRQMSYMPWLGWGPGVTGSGASESIAGALLGFDFYFGQP